MTDHNTLDDLVRVARDRVSRCQRRVGCDKPATRAWAGDYRCDEHGVFGDRELTYAPAIRRLVAAGVLK